MSGFGQLLQSRPIGIRISRGFQADFTVFSHTGLNLVSQEETMSHNENTHEASVQTSKKTIRSSLFLKLLGLATILTVSLIPGCFTNSLIRDRQNYEAEAISSIVGNWAAQQEIGAVEFVVPYHYMVYDAKEKKHTRLDHQLTLIPSRLAISTTDEIETRKRGIFEIPIYKARLVMKGEFRLPKDIVPADATEIQTPLSQNLRMGFRNSGAISEFDLKIDGVQQNVRRTPEGFVLTFSERTIKPGESVSFEFHALLNGYRSLEVRTAADDFEAHVKSKWPHPSFQGQLPVEQKITPEGFEARWKLIQVQATQGLTVGFVQPVNIYSQAERALKYSFLITTLVLASLFLIETLWKLRIHPMQYLLMTLPLSAFYVLLLATSEQIGFAAAYAGASVAVVGLLYFYFRGIGATGSQSNTLVLILGTLKALIYTMLSSEDFALLIGSISLFLVLAAFMMMTRKVDWSNSMARPRES